MPADGSTATEEKVWNADDVILAAELGKALYEQNKILYEALEKARVDNSEKELEFELLNQQLSELRDLIQKKTVLLEEAESHILELDRINHRLVQESAAAKKQIKRLSAYTVYLEQQVSGQEECVKPCSCAKPSNPRSLSAGPLESYDRWALRTGCSSPVSRGVSPSDYLLARHPYRPCTVKDDFIDDELSDQPLLGSCLLLPTDALPMCACDAPSEIGSRPRCLSCPTIFGLDLTHHAHTNRTTVASDRRTTPVIHLSKSIDRSASHDVIITSAVPEGVCPQSHDTPAIHEPCDWSSVESSADLKSLRDLLDDALFIKRLETIYHIKLRSQIPNDYQPSYKQLFQDTFKLIRSARTPIPHGAT